jgi:hypothetical protein
LVHVLPDLGQAGRRKPFANPQPVPASTLLLIRFILTLLVLAAAWRFGVRGVIGLLLVVVALVMLLRGSRSRQGGEDGSD